MDGEVLTEVPQNLQMLVRLVVRGFYAIEDMLIVDMLVRNLCMDEEHLCQLLKFDRKMLRQRINTLKADKLIQGRYKMVTVEDGKTQKEQYYFINYKSFVNVVKYKLDHIRKKLEMEERDQTSRSSFICENCQRTYTDLEADQLLDIATGQLLCIICRCEVQEDMSGMPRHDSRLLLSTFNEQMERLFNLLKEVENIKLSAEFSEPKPQDYNNSKKPSQKKDSKSSSGDRTWSGESTKKTGFQVEGSIDVNISTMEGAEETVESKETPMWLSEASSFITANITTDDPNKADIEEITAINQVRPSTDSNNADDVLSLLQAHEKKKRQRQSDSDSDSSIEEIATKASSMPSTLNMRTQILGIGDIEEVLISDDDDDDDNVPYVFVANEKISINDVGNDEIARMSVEEKNEYIRVFQEYNAGLDD